MNDSEVAVLREEIRLLRRNHRMLQVLAAISVIALTLLTLTLILFGRPRSVSASTTDKDGILHVRGLVVEDSSGHERVRLGAPLPDPMIHGVRKPRSGAISGLIISDANGNERGGYVTGDRSGEAFLSLDADGEQQALFLANPGGGINFDLYDRKGNEAQITVFRDGPKFRMKKAKQVVVDLPKPDEQSAIPK